MAQRLKDRIALVTGAGAGYGAEMAARFAAEGAKVACVDIDLAAARRTQERIEADGGVALALACDVARGDSVQAAIEAVRARWGGLGVLVNNAALTQKPARISRTPEADLDRLLAVNIKSLYHMAVHALPLMREGGGGSVINIASVTAIRPRPGMTWYNATKAAVISLTQSMAAELAPDRIRVNAIAPAAGRTPMFESMFGDKLDDGIQRMLDTIPLGRLCEPRDVADAAVFLASDEASFITGTVLPVDGGRLVG